MPPSWPEHIAIFKWTKNKPTVLQLIPPYPTTDLFYHYRWVLPLPSLEFHINGIMLFTPDTKGSYVAWIFPLSILIFIFILALSSSSVPFYDWVIFHCKNLPWFGYPFTYWWIFYLFSSLGLLGIILLWTFKFYYYEHSSSSFLWTHNFFSFEKYLEVNL